MTQQARLAVDIGGTFTDLVLALPGGTLSAKLLTTPQAPERAVLEGAAGILARAGIAAGDLGLVIHGTTLATNALIERKGARTALVTTDGFRDSLEIAYEHRFEQYDLYMERPEPLVARPWRFEVPERMAADGSVLLPLDEAVLHRIGDALRGEGIEALAVSFLHSYQNPAHELRAREILRDYLPAEVIALSAEVCPEIREYERTSTTVANAYVLPLMERYLGRLEDGLRALGCTAPLLLMMSSGGVTTVETARRFPIRLVESGPAGGAILAQRLAAENGIDRALAFDMGGTTAKITLIDDFRPQQARHFEIARAARFVKGSGIPVRIPVIDMVEIGAGGGSIARVDGLGRITVGPDSAGSVPGPACYGRGGTLPTVTDADLVLGWIDPARFAGGQIGLDLPAAQRAVAETIAAPLGLEPGAAARGITEIVTETMASAARVHAVENGKDTAGRTLIAFGGAAPLHAARLAQKLGMDRVLVPVGAGVGSAHGFLDAPIGYEVVRTRLLHLAEFDAALVNGLYDAMRAEAEAVVRLGAPGAALRAERTGYMRYRGQGHEVAVALPDGPYGADGAARLLAAFEEAYRALYGRVIPKLEVEVLTWTLSLAEAKDLPARIPDPPPQPAPAPAGTRRLVDPGSGEAVEAAIHPRAALPRGARIQGPAVIVEDETATLVPAGFRAGPNAAGHLLIERIAP
ncbi:hydantoinase/oxoprolinase family protein [Paracraurococcus ruber]|uniref:Methylhydantoinase n=1 Tax=Paracraurococcus ruber TaxID=77675 RepID=A0ABS1CTW7_9PROT|nr:hydantoinase/oxoprolinase family protein [Paracraurococcus ruber]MBK1657274.1 methylhydantoinase [Paracraurococcus ruber]TDG33160.1 hydantoinase/oxoprolinase family protein [Paracraurococcus ruber]